MEQEIVDITKEVLARLGYPGALIEVRKDEEERIFVRAHIKEEVGVLIGKGGETLRALQHILLLIVSKHLAVRFGPGAFVLDINDYQKEREQYLVSLAKKAAQDVRDTGVSSELEIMPASERRIVHVALAEEPGVATESMGTHGSRRVVVRPFKQDLGL